MSDMPGIRGAGRRGLWQGRDVVSRRGSGSRWSARSAGRNFQRGHWWRTDKTSTAWRKGGRGRREIRKAVETRPGLPAWHFPWKQDQGPSQSKGVVAGQWHRQRCGCTSGTVTSGTPWWYWRRATSATHGALRVTCWCRGGRWTGCNGAHCRSGRERSRSDGAWRRRRRGRSPPGNSAPMGASWICWPPSDSWGGWLPPHPSGAGNHEGSNGPSMLEADNIGGSGIKLSNGCNSGYICCIYATAGLD